MKKPRVESNARAASRPVPIRRQTAPSAVSRSRGNRRAEIGGTGTSALATEPTAAIDVTTTLPNANLVIDVYDLSQDANGDWTGPLVTRQGHLVRNPGNSTIPLTLWGADWKLGAGDRIAVRVTDNNQDWFLMAAPSGQPVTVRGGSVTLPFLQNLRSQTIQGDPGVQLAPYLETHIATAPADAVSSAVSFTLPPAMKKTAKNSVYSGAYTEPVGGAAQR